MFENNRTLRRYLHSFPPSPSRGLSLTPIDQSTLFLQMFNGNLRYFGLLSCVYILCVGSSSQIPLKPNIIIIIADDLGFDDVSFRGSNEFLTLNIDALAYHGIILDRFYAPAICTPSRAALLTGLYPIHTGTQFLPLGNGAHGALPTDLKLMPEIFRNAGYGTNLIGKWNLGHSREEYTPTLRGFDHHFGYWGNHIDHYQRRAKATPYCNHSIGYDFRNDLNVDCRHLGTYVTDLFDDEAERIIMENSTDNVRKPLFLMIAHAVPHAPLQAPQSEEQKFAYIKDPARRTYATMVSILDRSIGRVIRNLERANMLENSIIVFSSDNGAASVGWERNAGSNWPFRGQKDSPWEGGVRLPAAIWSPLLATSRQRIFQTSFYIGDWLPTLAAAVGIQIPISQTLDGQNLWPALMDASKVPNKVRRILHSLDPKRHFVSFMRGNWKYINGTTSNGLYDNVVTYREIYDLDPRSQRYVIEVRNSMASKALSKFDTQRLTQHRIEALRSGATVHCGGHQRGCNPLIEECLFNLEEDPCEQHNLAHDSSYHQTLSELREETRGLAESAIAPIQNSCRNVEQSDPALHDCTWSNFLDSPRSSVRRQCSSEGPPCEAV